MSKFLIYLSVFGAAYSGNSLLGMTLRDISWEGAVVPAIELHLDDDLYLKLLLKLMPHNRGAKITCLPADEQAATTYKNKIIIRQSDNHKVCNIYDDNSFKELLRNDNPISTNGKRKLKNILHSFAYLQECRRKR